VFRRQLLSVAILSAATLLLETTLTRLFAVAQFYHFAFLIISLALLGFGASGTLLSIFPGLQKTSLERLLAYLGLGFVVSVGVAYIIINFLPFDSYSIAWDRRQIFRFFLFYVALTIPFIISGLGVGSALAQAGDWSHKFYAANLLGSGLGVLLTPSALFLAGVPGAILLSVILGLLACLLVYKQDQNWDRKQKPLGWLVSVVFMGTLFLFILLTAENFQNRAPLGMTISPYKGLAQARRFPNSKTIYQRWNAISRLDLVVDAGTHQLPGLSYQYPGLPPEQIGLSVDADALQAVTLIQPDDFDAAAYLPESIVFELLPDAQVLVLDAGGGLGVLQALAGGAENVTVVVNNSLIPQAIAYAFPDINAYAQSNVRTIIESERIYLQQEDELFDIIFLPLTNAFRPVSSGVYSLSENDLLTVESFSKILSRLKPGGVFIFTRWMQLPPSESIRAIAILVEAIEQAGILAPRDALVIYRGIQTVTVMFRSTGWTSVELAAVRNFAQDRKYDLVWLPDIKEDETNHFNRIPEPVYYLTIREILTSQDRDVFYENYPYDISPPSDNRPFFFHFFKWEQTPEVLASLGHIWQPFGGSGYFVLVALLLTSIMLSFGMILFPIIWQRKQDIFSVAGISKVLIYFSLLGIAFLFIEIPLIQYWILLLGHPTYAFTVVVAVLLVFSGIGSAFARTSWLPRRAVFVLLLVMTFMLPFSVQQLSGFLLSLPLWERLLFSVFSLAPLGILMGLPFPLGIAWLQTKFKMGIPLAWAVNGFVSVIASVMAAMIFLTYGYKIVLLLGACAYTCAALLYMRLIRV